MRLNNLPFNQQQQNSQPYFKFDVNNHNYLLNQENKNPNQQPQFQRSSYFPPSASEFSGMSCDTPTGYDMTMRKVSNFNGNEQAFNAMKLNVGMQPRIWFAENGQMINSQIDSQSVRREFEMRRQQQNQTGLDGENAMQNQYFNEKNFQDQISNNISFTQDDLLQRKRNPLQEIGQVGQTPDWSLNLPTDLEEDHLTNHRLTQIFEKPSKLSLINLHNQKTAFSYQEDIEEDADMQQQQQTPASPHFKEHLQYFEGQPKCLFGVEEDDAMAYMKSEDQEKRDLLKMIQDYKSREQDLEDQLFPTKPMCLMETPEFSQEKKRRPVFNRQCAPFSQRQLFDSNSIDQDNKYLGSFCQRKYEFSLQSQPKPRERKTKTQIQTFNSISDEQQSLQTMIGQKTLLKSNSNISTQPPLITKRMRVQQDSYVDFVSSKPQQAEPFGYVSLKSHDQTLIFNLFKDADIGLDENLLLDLQPRDEVYEQDSDQDSVLEADVEKCLADFYFAMNECSQLGELLVTSVLLRNPEIKDRCNKPELFDREGRLKAQYLNPSDEPSQNMMMEEYVQPMFERLQLQ